MYRLEPRESLQISFSSIYIDVVNGEHEVIIINGTPDNIKPSSILCNIMRGTSYQGNHIYKYLNQFNGASITISEGDTLPQLIYYKKAEAEYRSLFNKIIQTYLKINKASGIIEECLEELEDDGVKVDYTKY